MTERIIKSSPLRSSNTTSPLRSSNTTSPLRSSNATSSTTSSPSRPSLKRKYTQDTSPTLSRSSTLASDDETTPWTKDHWKKLEDWYIRKNRDYKKAANSFYYFESLINIELPKHNETAPTTKELWPLDQIVWRSQCLDTSVKFHNGLLPSERKKKKKKRLSRQSSSSSIGTVESEVFKKPILPARSSKTATPVVSGASTPLRSLSTSSLP